MKRLCLRLFPSRPPETILLPALLPTRRLADLRAGLRAGLRTALRAGLLAALRAGLLAAILVQGACSSEQQGQARILLHLSLPSHALAKSGDPSPIEKTPLVLWASIDADDLASPVTGQWSGNLDQDPTLALSVEAGTERTLSVLLFALAEDRVETFRALKTGLDLVPGDQTVSLTLEPTPEWTLEAQLVPDGQAPIQAAVMEVQTRLLFPAAQVTEDQGTLTVTLDHIPVGRFFYLLVQWPDGTWSDPLTACPLWSGKEAHLARTISLADGSC